MVLLSSSQWVCSCRREEEEEERAWWEDVGQERPKMKLLQTYTRIRSHMTRHTKSHPSFSCSEINVPQPPSLPVRQPQEQHPPWC